MTLNYGTKTKMIYSFGFLQYQRMLKYPIHPNLHWSTTAPPWWYKVRLPQSKKTQKYCTQVLNSTKLPWSIHHGDKLGKIKSDMTKGFNDGGLKWHETGVVFRFWYNDMANRLWMYAQTRNWVTTALCLTLNWESNIMHCVWLSWRAYD